MGGTSRRQEGGKKVEVSHLVPSTEVRAPIRQPNPVTAPPHALIRRWALVRFTTNLNISAATGANIWFCAHGSVGHLWHCGAQLTLVQAASWVQICSMSFLLRLTDSWSTFFSWQVTDTREGEPRHATRFCPGSHHFLLQSLRT